MKQLNFLFLGLCALASCATPPTQEAPIDTGFQDILFTDDNRVDAVNAEQSRVWSARIFYPACGDRETSAYARSSLIDVLIEIRYYGLADHTLNAWRDLSIDGADAQPCPSAYPLVTFSIGLGVAGVHYSYLAEALAARGYIVAIVDHPYGGVAALPDGRFMSAADDAEMALIDQDPTILEKKMSEWVDDIRVTIIRLLEGGSLGGVTIDASKIAAIGHSMGGAAALDACAKDSLIGACVNMDGAPFGAEIMERGLKGKTAVFLSNPLYTDDELRERGRDPEQWNAMGGQIQSLWRDLSAKGGNENVIMIFAGTGHMSFSDAPLVSPGLITQFGGQPMDGDRASAVIVDALDAFFQSAFDQGSISLETYLAATPEASLAQ